MICIYIYTNAEMRQSRNSDRKITIPTGVNKDFFFNFRFSDRSIDTSIQNECSLITEGGSAGEQ